MYTYESIAKIRALERLYIALANAYLAISIYRQDTGIRDGCTRMYNLHCRAVDAAIKLREKCGIWA